MSFRRHLIHCLPILCLDLGHGGSAFANIATASHAGTSTDEIHSDGRSEQGKSEPEKCSGSLEHPASFCHSLCQAVAEKIPSVTAAVYTESGGKDNTGDEIEEGSKTIHSTQNHGLRERLYECGCHSIENDNH